jgi:hypothetical protein
MSAHADAIVSARRRSLFFPGIAIALGLAVFVGFAPTYYLKTLFGTPQLTALLQVHGALFTAWMVLLVAQTSLIANDRVRLHQKLGMAGAMLAVLMVVAGVAVAIAIAQLRIQTGELAPGGMPPLMFMTVPIAGMIVFPGLVGAALWFRRTPDVHKRLMIIATIELATAGIARLPLVETWGPIGFFGVANLFLIALVIFDVKTRGRVHQATAWGGAILVASQPLRLVIGGTEWWQATAAWLVGA